MEVISYYTLDNILIFSTINKIYVYDIIKNSIIKSYVIEEKYSKFNIDNSCGNIILIPLSKDNYICGDIFNNKTYKEKKFMQKEKVKIDSNITFMVKSGKEYNIAVGNKLIKFNNCKSGFTCMKYDNYIKSFIFLGSELYIIDSENNILPGKSIYGFGNLQNILKQDNSLLFNYKKEFIVSITRVTEEYINKYTPGLDEDTKNKIMGKCIICKTDSLGNMFINGNDQLFILNEDITPNVNVTVSLKDEWVILSYYFTEYGYREKRNIIIRNRGNYFSKYGLSEYKVGNVVVLNIINQDINIIRISNGPYSLDVGENDTISLNKV